MHAIALLCAYMAFICGCMACIWRTMACISWAMRSWPMARHSGVACDQALGVACVIGCVYGVYPLGYSVLWRGLSVGYGVYVW